MIDDVEVKRLQIDVDERGYLTEVWRSDCDFYVGEDDHKMPYFSDTYSGISRTWYRHHRGQFDQLVVPRGKAKVGIYDDRGDSPAQGQIDTCMIREENGSATRVLRDYWYEFKTVGDERILLLNFPTDLYDYEDLEEDRLPYDTDKIPLDWEEPPHE